MLTHRLDLLGDSLLRSTSRAISTFLLVFTSISTAVLLYISFLLSDTVARENVTEDIAKGLQCLDDNVDVTRV